MNNAHGGMTRQNGSRYAAFQAAKDDFLEAETPPFGS